MDKEDKIEWLNEICSEVFGSKHWKPMLSSRLGINDRSIRQWAAGERTIPDPILRDLLTLAHNKANTIIRRAEKLALDMRNEPAYERVVYQPGLQLDEIRRDLYTEKRAWFDIDGQLFALNENGTTIDVHGNEKLWSGVTILPDGVTVDDLIQARDRYIDENGEYD